MGRPKPDLIPKRQGTNKQREATEDWAGLAMKGAWEDTSPAMGSKGATLPHTAIEETSGCTEGKTGQLT